MQDKIVCLWWRGIAYQVPQITDQPIVLSTREVVIVGNWDTSLNPIQPPVVRYLFTLVVRNDQELATATQFLSWVTAKPVALNFKTICPNGCLNPSQPYCMQCGQAVTTEVTTEPLGFIPCSPFEKDTITRDGYCPNCGRFVSFHVRSCPQCHTTLTDPEF